MLKISAVELWRSWKTQFPRFAERTWTKRDWERAIKPGSWTNDVIYPFIQHYLANDLGCKVRIRDALYDFILADPANGNYLAHIEHENDLWDIFGEFHKLRYSPPPLKCAISYGTKQDIADVIHDLLEPAVQRAVQEMGSQEWLFIFGFGPTRTGDWVLKPSDWIAYRSVSPSEGQNVFQMIEEE